MITFFPSPYEHELLYSILSRYHIRSSNVSFSSTMEDLFGTKSTNAVLDLPSNMDNLIDNMPIGNEYISDYFIRRHTLYPYYEAFLEDKKARDVLKIMKSDNGSGIHSRVGAVPFISEIDKHFRICPICYEEEVDKYGEGYLHRLHNSPGVVICPKHEEFLQISKEPISYYGRNAYINVMDIEFWANKYLGDINKREKELFLSLTRDIEYLLNNDVINRPRQWFVDQYKVRLKELGLSTPKGIVNINEVFKQFIVYYGDNFLQIFDFNIYAVDKTNWIKYLFRNQKHIVHPLKHILLSRFLGIRISDLFEKKLEYKPFGNGEWPCLNKICSHYLKPSVKDITITYNSHAKKPVGEFKCECGFTYLRIGPDLNEDDRYKIGKVKELGWLWEQELIQLLKEGLSLNTIENRLNTSQKTIKKYASKLGFDGYLNSRCKVRDYSDKKLKDQLKEGKKNRKIQEFRERWLKLREDNPDKGANELRLMDINLNDYLLRNDREWLYNHYPPKKKRVSGGAVVDWDKKDEEVLQKVKIAINAINNTTGRPKKITITLIGKKIGMAQFLYSNIDRLSKTKVYIKNSIDTNKSYQIRKVKWAIQELMEAGEGVIWWKVYDKAALNEGEIKDFKEELKNSVY